MESDSYKIHSEYLRKILEFSAIINSSLEIEEIRKRTIESSVKLVNCEAGRLLLFDEETSELYFHVALGEKADKIKAIRLKHGEGIAGWLAQHRESLIKNDVQNDPSFFKGADQKCGFITKKLMCIPVLMKDKLIGVLPAKNKRESYLMIMMLNFQKPLPIRLLLPLKMQNFIMN